MLEISLIIPAYNEQGGILAVLEQHQALLQDTGWVYEIIVVNDGSTDSTKEILSHLDFNRTVVINHAANQGYGAALKTGILRARYDLVCITDADRTYPPEHIPELVAQADQVDMVVGARTGDHVSVPWVRKPAKWMIRRLAEAIANQPIPDINSGLRIFRRDVALRFMPILPNGFSFTTTITLGLLTNGYSVVYVPIDYHARVGKSKIKPIRDTLNFMMLILRIGLYFAPLRIFVPISLCLILLSLFWGIVSFAIFGQPADVSSMVIFMTAVQILMLGLLAELINHRTGNEFLKKD